MGTRVWYAGCLTASLDGSPGRGSRIVDRLNPYARLQRSLLASSHSHRGALPEAHPNPRKLPLGDLGRHLQAIKL
ncbi:hypothetical protein CTA1_7314 [Colletotrichum tanaceti]|uniref:Uncharacterized protein n=1 Tax=Colletotrichum tanaceti TaxID=1306861 RepID=A0A4U6XBW4_9PEZI|nr:hypothetical protein CTA1_7314 [Colletotrichum tanaceti]